MNFKLIQIILVVLAVGNIQLVSAETQIAFVDGKKFIDYELTNTSRNKSLEILKKDFNKVFTKLSLKYLKEGQSISVGVTNLDLAGYIVFNTGPNNQDIRIVDNTSPVRLYFNYKVLAEDGSVVSKGEHKIKEFLYLSSSSNRLKRRGNLSHFIPLLDKWFKSEFS